MTEKKNGAMALLKWWPVLTVAALSAAAWGGNSVQINEHARRLTVNEKVLKELIESRGSLKATAGAIQRSQDRTEKDVRAILRQLERSRRPVR